MVMDEEALFDIVNEAVMYAKQEIEAGRDLKPFAMLLYDEGIIRSIDTVNETDHDSQYEKLIIQLREKTDKEADIAGLVIVTRVMIPEAYQAQTESGIRVHLEEREKRGDKIGARFLYVPYQLYQNSDSGNVTMQLHAPIAVSFPPEIFI